MGGILRVRPQLLLGLDKQLEAEHGEVGAGGHLDDAEVHQGGGGGGVTASICDLCRLFSGVANFALKPGESASLASMSAVLSQETRLLFTCDLLTLRAQRSTSRRGEYDVIITITDFSVIITILGLGGRVSFKHFKVAFTRF